MFKHVKRLLILALSVGLLSSCFEIEEQITFNNNGSGSYSFVLDMAEMKVMFEAMGSSVDELEESPGQSFVNDFNKDQRPLIEGVPGISNIQAINDEEAYKFGYSFDFTNVQALNGGLNVAFANDDSPKRNEVYAEAGKGYFARRDPQNIKQELFAALGEQNEEMKAMGMDPADIFGQVNYHLIYNFPKAVKSVDNPDAEIAENGRTVELRLYIFDPETPDASLDMRVDY